MVSVVVGDTFAAWTVIDAMLGTDRKVLCRCACGAEHRVFFPDLVRGRSRSCKPCSIPRIAASVHATAVRRRARAA